MSELNARKEAGDMAYTRDQYEEAVAIYERALVNEDKARGALIRARHQTELARKALVALEVRPGVPRWTQEQVPAGGWTAETWAGAR